MALLLALRNRLAARPADAGAPRGAAVTPAKRRKIYERFARANPEPATELVYSTPFELLVAVVLSAQATDVSVNKATAKLFPVANTPAAIFALGEEGLKSYIKTIGLFNSKAKNLIEDLRDARGRARRRGAARPRGARVAAGRRPQDGERHFEHGVRRADDRRRHAHLPRRQPHGPGAGANVRAVEDELVRVTPDEFKRHAHHWLILHGRYVCKARKPECPRCLIVDLCEYAREDAAK